MKNKSDYVQKKNIYNFQIFIYEKKKKKKLHCIYHLYQF